jgi:hypothetical protein
MRGTLLVFKLPAPCDLVFGGVKLDLFGDFLQCFLEEGRTLAPSQVQTNGDSFCE